MRFAYQRLPTAQPIVSLDGRMERPKGIIAVTVLGPLRSWVHSALLDTGADDTVFPESTAARIGIDLANAPTRTASGVGAQVGLLRFARVSLRVADNHEQCEWQGW